MSVVVDAVNDSPPVKKIKMNQESRSSNDLNICSPISDLKTALQYRDVKIDPKNIYTFNKSPFVVPNALGECHQELTKLSIKQRVDKHTVPKTLVCHDMKGGYLEDKYIDGCDIGNGYTFYRWSEIDIFVYFSHHFITIPPPGWVNIAHRNNVKVLGTLITEGESGKNLCNEILKSEDTWRSLAKSLVNICVLNSFDGWLLNIENPIEYTKALVDFVRHLTQEMRKVNNEFIVLWYDSVIQSGRLKWQDELNDLNKCFFDACDGIFLNYTWTEEKLRNSIAKAQHRILDVYVGVDVFGRNCFGGGGFKSHLAADIIRKCGLSIAIFAPGWTHETLKINDTDNFFDMFCKRDNGFWLNLHPYFYTHPIVKPFVTTFDLGVNETSYNLNNQELMLSRPTHCGSTNIFKDDIIEQCDCIEINTEGCKPKTISYLIKTHKLDKNKDYVHKLFTCNMDAVKNIAISCVVKNVDNTEGDLDLVVLTRDSVGRRYNYHLTGSNEIKEFSGDVFIINPYEKNDTVLKTIKKSCDFGKISNGWIIRNYIIFITAHMKIMEIGVIINGDSMLLGGFAVQTNLKID